MVNLCFCFVFQAVLLAELLTQPETHMQTDLTGNGQNLAQHCKHYSIRAHIIDNAYFWQ